MAELRIENPYLKEVYSVLPRLLALFDTDPLSPTYGIGDRYRWAWKLIDFGNGTFQGAAHGLARLLAHQLLPEGISRRAIESRIAAMFRGARWLTRKNGSLEEAFPFESSFCVTALVAYDLLSAVELLDASLSQEQRTHYLATVAPMIRFLHRADEAHALISNHLATATVALFKWQALGGGEGVERGTQLLSRILEHQSDEGWFREYEGADPGYQSLCTYYLADLHRRWPDLGLLAPLQRSIQFLWHFAHPDGSFGGLYGSRNTRFFVPAGIEFLAAEIPAARALASFMRTSIAKRNTVALSAMDEPNLIPLFNAYCWAAALYQQGEASGVVDASTQAVPALSSDPFRRQYSEAGLLVDKGGRHYTIISWKKGGVCYHFSQHPSHHVLNAGVVLRRVDGRLYSTQAHQQPRSVALKQDTLTVVSGFVEMKKELPSPIQFVLLRLLGLTLMRSLKVGDFIKKRMVRMLITGKKSVPIYNKRTVRLGPELSVTDELQDSQHALKRFGLVDVNCAFSDIHMASQGYWQRQDDGYQP